MLVFHMIIIMDILIQLHMAKDLDKSGPPERHGHSKDLRGQDTLTHGDELGDELDAAQGGVTETDWMSEHGHKVPRWVPALQRRPVPAMGKVLSQNVSQNG